MHRPLLPRQLDLIMQQEIRQDQLHQPHRVEPPGARKPLIPKRRVPARHPGRPAARHRRRAHGVLPTLQPALGLPRARVGAVQCLVVVHAPDGYSDFHARGHDADAAGHGRLGGAPGRRLDEPARDEVAKAEGLLQAGVEQREGVEEGLGRGGGARGAVGGVGAFELVLHAGQEVGVAVGVGEEDVEEDVAERDGRAVGRDEGHDAEPAGEEVDGWFVGVGGGGGDGVDGGPGEEVVGEGVVVGFVGGADVFGLVEALCDERGGYLCNFAMAELVWEDDEGCQETEETGKFHSDMGMEGLTYGRRSFGMAPMMPALKMTI